MQANFEVLDLHMRDSQKVAVVRKFAGLDFRFSSHKITQQLLLEVVMQKHSSHSSVTDYVLLH